MLKEQVEKLLIKASKKTKTLQFAMNLPVLGIDYAYSSTIPNQQFHSASVGKLMTTTLIFIAIEQGRLSLDTLIKDILEPGELDKLFVVEHHDFQDEITIKHLLAHMSGVNDYFESKTIDGSSFFDEVSKNPGVFWKPDDLLDFTRNRQMAIARPGEKFLYSDTGYVLLGLIVETVFNMPFHQALDTYIFEPSHMKDTSLCFYSDRFDQKALAPLYLNGIDVHLFRSLSCDFSGGGLSTTSMDLLKFLDYLQNERFISKKSLDQMAEFNHRFRQGLYYGAGMMQIHFEEFFFLLKSLPRLQGHLGVTGVHAWYDPATKSSFVLNVGNTKDMTKSFKLLIKILQLVQREYQKR
ncbi:MAG: serine hydrolase domain-containing protein [Clostridiaceae bacterium]